jgi:hypothetical protein
MDEKRELFVCFDSVSALLTNTFELIGFSFAAFLNRISSRFALALYRIGPVLDGCRFGATESIPLT